MPFRRKIHRKSELSEGMPLPRIISGKSELSAHYNMGRHVFPRYNRRKILIFYRLSRGKGMPFNGKIRGNFRLSAESFLFFHEFSNFVLI
jgi:hypothetical protein